MTVASTTRRADAVGNGAASVYPFAYRILDDDDLLVSVEDTDGNITELAKTTDYTVSGVGAYAGGSITLVDSGQAWLDADGDLLTDYRITIRRRLTITQTTDLRNRGGFYPEDHETAFDRLTMICLQQQDEIDRSIKFPETDDTTIVTTLPSATRRANRFAAFDPLGGVTVASGTGADAALRADLGDSVVVGNGDNLVAGKRTLASAVAFTLHQYNEKRAIYLDLDFGAVGDGVTDDTTAFANAATALRTLGGGTLILSPGKTYKVLPTGGTAGASMIDLQNCVGVTIEGRGARILTGSVTAIQKCFDLNAATDVVIRNLKLQSGYDTLDPSNGIDWIVARQGAKRILLENLSFAYGRIGFCALGAIVGQGTDTDGTRAESIVALNLDFSACYYPLNFQGAGDNFFARGIRTRSCGRSYFPYNCKNHDVELDSLHGGPFDDVLLKVYADTRYYSRLENIRLVYHSDGRSTGAGNQGADNAHVALEFQLNDAGFIGPGYMQNIDITIEIEPQVAPIQSSRVFILRKADATGAADGTGRGHQVSNVTVRGKGRSLQNLLGNWFDVCGRATEVWTGDPVSGLRLSWSGSGDAAQKALNVNGQGLTANTSEQALLIDGFFANTSLLALANVAAKHVALRNSKFGNYQAGYRNTETYTVSWTASAVNPAIGNGTLKGSYVLHDGLCTVNITLTIGATTTLGTGDWRFSLPFTPAPTADMAPAIGSAILFDSGTAWLIAAPSVSPATAYAVVYAHNAAVPVSGTVPIAWVADDALYLTVTYPIGTV